jgi:hypothetical protein
MATNIASTMSTPLANLPIKTQQNGSNNELQDPLVQDVLKEFEEEIAASKKNTFSNPQFQLPPPQFQPPPPQFQPPPPQFQQHPPQFQQFPSQFQQNKNSFFGLYLPNNIIDTDLIRKSLIITIIILLLNYSNIFNVLYNFLPTNINEIVNNYDFYIKSLTLFIIFYFLLLNNLI